MIPAGLHAQESARLRDLHAYGILDTPADERFDTIVGLAARVFSVPISAVSLVDEKRLWFKASIGLDMTEAERSASFCGHALHEADRVLVVRDALEDNRFHDNPLVSGAHGIRFYAGAPILSPRSGLPMGTLCILDQEPRSFSSADCRNLQDMARAVASVMDLHFTSQRLEIASTQDPLTRLANRTLFETSVASLVEDLPAHGRVGMLHIDIDHFKQINETFGHEAGDEILNRFAEILKTVSRSTDLPARLGGDMFCILMRDWDPDHGPAQLAQRLIEQFQNNSFEVGGHNHDLSISIGHAVFPEHGYDGPSLNRAADGALRHAKMMGRGRAVSASDLPETFHAEATNLRLALRHDLICDGLRLAWQPYVSARLQSVIGYEALLRWKSRDFGEIAPAVFLPLAESMGLMGVVDEVAMKAACNAAATWPQPQRVSVNLSSNWFSQGIAFDRIKACLDESGLDPNRLLIEVKERTLIAHPAIARDQIGMLRDIGVKIALDDFGTGYSSLASVAEFEIDEVKLDISLIRKVGSDSRADAVIRCVVALARELDIAITAKGVETIPLYKTMQALGFDIVQGYLFGRPVEEIDFSQQIEDNDESLLAWQPQDFDIK